MITRNSLRTPAKDKCCNVLSTPKHVFVRGCKLKRTSLFKEENNERKKGNPIPLKKNRMSSRKCVLKAKIKIKNMMELLKGKVKSFSGAIKSRPKLQNGDKSNLSNEPTRCSQRLKSKNKKNDRRQVISYDNSQRSSRKPNKIDEAKDECNDKTSGKKSKNKKDGKQEISCDNTRRSTRKSNKINEAKDGCNNKKTSRKNVFRNKKTNVKSTQILKNEAQRNLNLRKSVSVKGKENVFKEGEKLLSPDKPKTKKRDKSLRDSFERYGIILPTCEEILDAKEKLRRETEMFDAFEEKFGKLDDTMTLTLSNINNNHEVPEEENLLGCEHLKKENLVEYFNKNLVYLQNICDGKQPSERHDKFHNFDPRWNLTTQDLVYSPSILVFNDKQRDILFKMLEDHFDTAMENTGYLYKVLLPELCFKIFRDLHGMTVKSAVDYLNWRPVE